MTHTLGIRDGIEGTAATVAVIAAMCRDPETVPELRQIALRITQGAGHRKDDKARAIFHWVRANVRYVNDPDGIEHLTDPLKVARQALNRSPLAAEDCDGHAGLVAALCCVIGLPVRFVLTEDENERNPNPHDLPWYAHIHTEAQVERGWMPLDTALWWVPIGSRVKGRRVELELDNLVTSDQVAGLRARVGRHNGLGFVAQAISAGGKVTVALINARAMKNAEHSRREAEVAVANAFARYDAAELAFDVATSQLEAERAARLLAESSAETRARTASLADTVFTLGLAAGGLFLLSRS